LIKNKKARIFTKNNLHMVIIDCDSIDEAKNIKAYFNKIKNVNIDIIKQKPNYIYGNILEEIELSLILSVLSACNNNKTHAAKLLGISLRCLRKKINSLRGSSGN